MERSMEVQMDLYLFFSDYSKAFDKVKHEDLFKLLTQLSIDAKVLGIPQNLYLVQDAAIRKDNGCSEFEPIRRGVRQGCVMSPDLFNICSEMILRNINDHGSVKLNGHNITDLRCADDTVPIAGSENIFTLILDTVSAESGKRGLELNIKKESACLYQRKDT
ncbi:LINE-1 retrotransposable element orf2 protein [Plakobranchus ocellatus]|uniref:LINE-1 retrotransposable element orf2 protein n=1 Tax=Plakobranchus ocellatus TaxID=259542 RepID=A0AAV3ZPP6_9GAST|nr:LINE-1 retrotransposable element orf2 protein [Plakobranchus ocellatus]